MTGQVRNLTAADQAVQTIATLPTLIDDVRHDWADDYAERIGHSMWQIGFYCSVIDTYLSQLSPTLAVILRGLIHPPKLTGGEAPLSADAARDVLFRAAFSGVSAAQVNQRYIILHFDHHRAFAAFKRDHRSLFQAADEWEREFARTPTGDMA